MTYPEAVAFLNQLSLFGLHLGLENTRRLAERAGHPEHQLRFLHVAGTNGKGSTCAFLEAMLRESGLRVGLYTSPHLVRFTERIQVDRRPIPELDVARLTARLVPWLAEFPSEDHPTFFEAVTVLALLWFQEQQVDVVVWETGLGGRLDATNIVTPLVSIITTVDRDHEAFLGSTLEAIAREKAGIIKAGVPVVTGVRQPAALEVIQAVACEVGAPLVAVEESRGVPVPGLRGRHQLHNAAVALTALDVVNATLPVDADARQRGLVRAYWPGRFQVTELDGVCWVVDGGHNPAGVETFVETFTAEFPGQHPTLILGLLADKDLVAIGRRVAPLAGAIWVVPVPSVRTAEPTQVVEACRPFARAGTEFRVFGSLIEAMEARQGQGRGGPPTAVLGSLYLVGAALEWLGGMPADPLGTRSLNEYGTGCSRDRQAP